VENRAVYLNGPAGARGSEPAWGLPRGCRR
jgi:hypothetical protein